MIVSPDPNSVRAAQPEMVGRLMAILGPLAALVGAELALRPKFWGLIRPLRNWIMHIGRRFGAVRVGAAKRASQAGAARAERTTARVRLPGRRGWLVAELGYKAAAYRSQLEHLLGQPEMRAVMDAAPGFGRVLRPVCWMLGISRDLATSAPELAVVVVDAAGVVVPRRRDRAQPQPGKPSTVVWQPPPVEAERRVTPELAWNFAKYR